MQNACDYVFSPLRKSHRDNSNTKNNKIMARKKEVRDERKFARRTFRASGHIFMFILDARRIYASVRRVEIDAGSVVSIGCMPELEAKFQSFAHWRIRTSIEGYLRGRDHFRGV